MEQVNQQINQKTMLPIKTKLAVIYIKILGIFAVIGGIVSFLGLFLLPTTTTRDILIYAILPFCLGLFVYKICSFILKRKKWAWFLNITLFVIICLRFLIIGLALFFHALIRASWGGVSFSYDIAQALINGFIPFIIFLFPPLTSFT